MKNKLIKDERAVAQKRKIGSETCNLLLVVLGVSLFIKVYVFNESFLQYATELLCLFGASIYIVIRNIISGNDLFETKGNGEKSVVLMSLVVGFAVCVIGGSANYARYGQKYTHGIFFLATLIILFACGTVLTLLIYLPIYKLNKERQKKIAEELDEEEKDIK
ncbi:MAG: hypothetical protein PHX70_08845 [Clostridium sp.]|nr:hypothetical protein [Clostridium sp.]